MAWGWFAVVSITDGKILGGEAPGGAAAVEAAKALALRADTTQGAFWCAWWTADPRGTPDMLPDDFGVVVGALAHAEAIGMADRLIRRARGSRCFSVSVGEDFARRSWREGARRTVSAVEAARADGHAALKLLGLTPARATVAAVYSAFRRLAKRGHADRGGSVDMGALRDAKDRALDLAKVLEHDRAAGAYARGDATAAPKRRKKKPAAPAGATS